MKALTLAAFAVSLASIGLIILLEDQKLSSTGLWQYLEIALLPAIHLVSTYAAVIGLVLLYRQREKPLGRVSYVLVVVCLALWTSIVGGIIRSDIHKKVSRPGTPLKRAVQPLS